MKKYDSLGDIILEYRLRNNLSQAEFASKMDVDARTIIRWEKNKTQLKDKLEFKLSEITFIPHQVIRNLNSSTPILTYYDFDLRKYAPSELSTELPEAEWIKERMTIFSDRIRTVEFGKDVENILRFNTLQKDPLKTSNKELIEASVRKIPELNIIITDENNLYAGHCCYLPLKDERYQKIKSKEIKECDLTTDDLVLSTSDEQIVYYCHSITADCNENFFYIIGEVLRYFQKNLLGKEYTYALLTSRYDSYDMSLDLGIKLIWEDNELQKRINMKSPPRLYEGNFNAFLKGENN